MLLEHIPQFLKILQRLDDQIFSQTSVVVAVVVVVEVVVGVVVVVVVVSVIVIVVVLVVVVVGAAVVGAVVVVEVSPQAVEASLIEEIHTQIKVLSYEQ